MGFILWIIFGAFVGWVASLVMRTNSRQGAVLNIVIGIAGAIIGGWLMNLIGESGVTGFNVYSLVVAIIGSVVLIVIMNFFQRR